MQTTRESQRTGTKLACISNHLSDEVSKTQIYPKGFILKKPDVTRSTIKTIAETETKLLKEQIKDFHRQRYQLTKQEAMLKAELRRMLVQLE